MSNLNNLISNLCPNGVEYKKLFDVATIERGVRITKKNLVDSGLYPVISGGVAPMGRYDEYNRDANTITISSYGQAGYVDFINEKFWANDVCLTIIPHDIVKNKYLYYCLKNKQDFFYANTTKAIPDHIPTKVLLETEIPVPPLPIQEEIARILDNFTELTKELTIELTTELEDRKKQYEYYRDSLLTFNNDIKRVKLRDIAIDMYRGNGITRDQVLQDGFPCVRYGEIYTTYNTYFDKCVSHTRLEEITSPKFIEYGDLLFAITGESIEDIGKTVAYVGKDKCLVGGDILVMKHNQNPKYLSYALATNDAVEQKGKGKVKSKVVHTNAESIGNIEIYLPSLEIQERIVSVLDNFEKICNDLKIDLPDEIELRQKQYEYYRDMLLTFPENDLCLSKQASKQASIATTTTK